MLRRLLLLFVPVLLLAGCSAGQQPTVVDDPGYAQMIRRFPKVMQAKGFADEELRYSDSMFSSKKPYGQLIHDRLSPDFQSHEKGHDRYLGETWHRTLTPMSHEYMDKDGNGFFITHPSEKVAVRMLAVVDWNGTGEKDWLIRCRIESYRRGGLLRDYYLLMPEPDAGREPIQATVVGTADSYPPSSTTASIHVRDTSEYGKKLNLPKTEVHEYRPGEAEITAAPSQAPKSSIQERNL